MVIPLGRLEPLLRQLCQAIQAYHLQQQKVAGVGGRAQQQQLPLLRAIADRLEPLKSSLQALVELLFLKPSSTTTKSSRCVDLTTS